MIYKLYRSFSVDSFECIWVVVCISTCVQTCIYVYEYEWSSDSCIYACSAFVVFDYAECCEDTAGVELLCMN